LAGPFVVLESSSRFANLAALAGMYWKIHWKIYWVCLFDFYDLSSIAGFFVVCKAGLAFAYFLASCALKSLVVHYSIILL
jgi:hypothetical protein